MRINQQQAEDHIMQYAKFTMKPVALLVAILLGGCVGYTGYPSGDYGYSHRYSQPTYSYNGYPSGYDGRPSYSPYYGHAAYGGGY